MHNTHDRLKSTQTKYSIYRTPLKICYKKNFSNSIVFVTSLIFSSFIFSTSVYSNPVGGHITNGNATISQSPNQTVINQSSQKAIINWQSFNIGKGQTTHFQQPQGGSTLNRISPTQGASAIYGRLTATGQIILINPAGIYFGPSAYVNVGGIIASTADISNQNYLSGNYHFEAGSMKPGSVVNKGQIIAADHGLVALIGGNVSNDGLIEANLGQVVLGSGSAFTLTFAGNDLISFTVDKPTSDKSAGISNSGVLRANGGSVRVTANAAQGVLDNVINMNGLAEAKSVGVQNGEIILYGEGGKVKVSGDLIASGKQAGQKGGKVKVLGSNIAVNGNSKIDVSGDQGGGTVLIGGGLHGTGEPNALYVFMGDGTTINANAITNGNGGAVVLSSQYGTRFVGDIYARGGALGGNGGQVETFTGGILEPEGSVNASAPNGMSGNWFAKAANANLVSQRFLDFRDFDDLFKSIMSMNVATFNNALNTGTSVSIQAVPFLFTNGDLYVNAPIVKTTGNDAVLTLKAANNANLYINKSIASTNNDLGVNLSGKSVNVNSSINTNGGDYSSNSIAATNLNASISTLGGDFIANGTGINLADNVAVKTDAGSIIANAVTGTFKMGANSRLLSGDAMGSVGMIKIIADNVSLNTSGASSSQIGGSSAGVGSAKTIILQPSTQGRSIAIDISDPSMLQLSAQALNDIRATNVRLGSNTTGNITIGTWMPAATFAANGVLTLDAGGTISQTGAINLAQNGADLLLRDAQAVNLSGANNFDNIATNNLSGPISIRAGGSNALNVASLVDDIGLANGVATTGNNAIALVADVGDVNINSNLSSISGAINITSGNAITLNAGVLTSGDVTLASGKAILETDAGVINANVLSTNSATGTSLLTATNSIAQLNATNTQSGAIQIANNGTLAVAKIAQSGGDLAIANNGDLNLTGAVAVSGNADLNSTGKIMQGADGGALTANVLQTKSTDGTSLQKQGNSIARLDAINTRSGDIVLANTGALSLGNISQLAGGLRITNSGDLNLAGTVAVTGNVDLNTSTRITQATDSGSLTANAVATRSVDGTSLQNQANSIGRIDAVNTGSGDIQVANAGALQVGNISQAAGNLSIANTGDLNLIGAVAVSGNADLSSTGKIMQGADSGALTANVLQTKSTDGTSLQKQGNSIARLDAINTRSGDIVLANTGALSLGNVSQLAGGLRITNSGDLNLAGTVAVAGNVDLNTSTRIAQATDSGSLTANAVATRSVDGTSLQNQANSIGRIDAVNTGSGDIQLANTGALQVGDISQAVGNLSIANTGNLNLAGTVAVAGTVNLNAVAGSIAQATDSGSLTATAVATSSANGTSLQNQANSIGRIDAVNTGSGDIQLANTGALQVGDISQAVGNLSIANTGNLNLAGTVAVSGTVNLNAVAGSIAQATDSGSLTANAVATSSANGTSLQNQANSIGRIDAVNTGSGDIQLANTGALQVGDISQAVGNLSIANTGNLNLAGTVAVAGTVNLNAAAGSIAQATDSGSLTATAVATSSANGTSLQNQANSIGRIDAVNTGSGDIQLANTGALQVGDISQAVGNLSIANTGNLNLAGTVAVAGTVNLNAAAGSIAQATDSGSLTATAVATSSANGTSLQNQANSIGRIDAVNTGSGDIQLANTGALQVGDISQAVGNLSIANTGNLNLAGTVAVAGTVNLNAVAGSIAQATDSGSLTATAVATSSANGTSLQNQANSIGRIDAVNTGSGDIQVANTGALQVGDISQAVGNLSIANTGNLNLAGTVAVSGTVNLNAAGTIAQAADSGSLTANAVATSSIGGVSLTGTNNAFNALDVANTNGGGVEINNNSQTLAVSGIRQVGTTSDVTIRQAGTLNVSGTIDLGASTLSLSGSSIDLANAQLANGAATAQATVLVNNAIATVPIAAPAP